MHLHRRNVNDSFRTFVEGFDLHQSYPDKWTRTCTPFGSHIREDVGYAPVVQEESRNGPVLRIDEPVIVTYSHPRERILFNTVRDANPFFHLYEALWMLAGRNDVAPLAYYNSKIAGFSDDGKIFNGAYGYRWRSADNSGHTYYSSVDQLKVIVNHLKADPTSRRAVLSMWNVEDDLLKIGEGNCTCRRENNGGQHFPGCRVLQNTSKDVCCNLNVMFSLRPDMGRLGGKLDTPFPLDITVTNRSNDLLWGMLGANFVQFSILQEHVAAHLGVEVGRYHHISNNLHLYKDRPDWKPTELLADDTPDYYKGHGRHPEGPHKGWAHNGYKPFPLVRNPVTFDKELQNIVQMFSAGQQNDLDYKFEEPFFNDVARPMFAAFQAWKSCKDAEAALLWCEQIKADDWHIAARTWIERRIAKREAKNVADYPT